jgi:DNA-binding GntR family transcriptional regulator
MVRARGTLPVLIETDKRLALQAYEQILNMIMSGAARPGTMITERRLAESLAMSRTPIRDALLMLEGEGMLIRQGRIGLQVTPIRLEDFLDALQVRQLLEPEAARLAAGRMPGELLDALTETLNGLLEDIADGQTRPDRSVVRDVDNRLHEGIAQAAGNPALAQIVANLHRRTQMFDLRSVPERFEHSCREHLGLIAALRAGDAAEAARLMRKHLDAVRDSIIRRLAKR